MLYFCAARVLWVMMYRYEIIRKQKARSDSEKSATSITQSLHVHQTLSHGPEFYNMLKQPLLPYTEELGESALKRDKNFGA